MIDPKRPTQLLEDVPPARRALPLVTKRSVNSLPLSVRRVRTRKGQALMSAATNARAARALGGLDLHEHPAGGAVNRHKQVAALALVGHPRQRLHVDVHKARLVRRKGAVRSRARRRQQRLEVTHPVAAQAAIQPRARHVRVDELPRDGQQIIEREQLESCAAPRRGPPAPG